eukprot:TRINITY_DN8625_c1_g1_i1.p1 TRINITY_DN8625_c1_g1~~TRINITY_DN8625_c1_g1_i1.p1  ORF type:complete len:330 (+),score=121.07 TRINITY_DN8625_c1_g1_i1:80-1069(+)
MGETVTASVPLPGGRRTSDWVFTITSTEQEGDGFRVVNGTGRETSCQESVESPYSIRIADAPPSEGAKMLECLNHRHIRKVFMTFTHEGQHYTVAEPVGASLYLCVKRRGGLSERQALAVFQQLLSAVHDLHSKRIAHRCLTPHTVLLDEAEQEAKVDGFDGACTFDRECDSVSSAPTVPDRETEFVAPEVLAGGAHSGVKADLYSLGTVLRFLLPADEDLVDPAAANGLVARLTSEDPTARPQDIDEVLNDAWVNTKETALQVDVDDGGMDDSFGMVSPVTAADDAERLARDRGLTPKGPESCPFSLQPLGSPASEFRKLRLRNNTDT